MLARCGIPRERAQGLPWRHVDSFTAAEMFGRNGSDGDLEGTLIPNIWPGNDAAREYRLRRAHPDLEIGADGRAKEKNKYLSPPGAPNLLYFAHGTLPEWLEDPSLPAIVLEGKKKCEASFHLSLHGLGDAADRPRFLPVALPGVWSSRGKVGKQDGPNGERQDIKGVIPDFNRIAWQGREVIILFDANVHDGGKPGGVSHARNTLAKELRDHGAHVLFADIPADLVLKGIDDVAGQLGPDAALALIAKAFDPKKKKANTGQPSKIVIDEIPSVRSYASEDVEFIIPRLIVKGTVSLFSGMAGVGKTTFLLWLMGLIARGLEILGGQCQSRPVLYLTKENPAEFIVDVLNRLDIEDGPGTNLTIWGSWLPETAPPPACAHILTWVSSCSVPPVLVVDSLISFFDGDENDASHMRQFFHQRRSLIQAGAAAVIVLHHPGKSENASVYRGSSDIAPAVDALYKLTNSGDGKLERLYLKAHKARFAAQKRELVFEYRDDGFVADERPAAPYETVTQQLKNLLANLAGCTKTKFENEAQARGLTRTRAAHVASKHLAQYVDQRQQEDAANATVNRELAALKRMFSLGHKATPKKVLHIPSFPHLMENNARQGFLEDGLLQRLVEGAELWFRTLVECAASIGWRHHELLTLRVKQIDLQHRVLRLEPEPRRMTRARSPDD